MAELFEPKPDRHGGIAVDETTVKIEEQEIYVWAAIDVETFEVVHVEVSPGRSDLNAFLFLKTVLQRCRGESVVLAARGPWYNCPLDDLDLPCGSWRETWGERSLVEDWFFMFKYRTMPFSTAFRTAVHGSLRPLGKIIFDLSRCTPLTLTPLGTV
jgi:putative transposase